VLTVVISIHVAHEWQAIRAAHRRGEHWPPRFDENADTPCRRTW
jgi:hypothetical protein